MNRVLLLWSFVAAFMLASPALAAPPEDDKAAEKADDKADDGKAEAKEETKTDEAKADEAKAEGDGDEKAVEKADEKAEGPAEVETDEEAVEAAGELINAIQTKHWGLAIGLGLTLLVFVLRKVKVLSKVPSKALPWVTAVLGILGYMAAAFMSDGANLTDAALGGLMTGAAAVGLWEMLLKHFLQGKKAEA